MGRPIKSFFFGNRNYTGALPYEGGYTITSITVDSAGSGYTDIPELSGVIPQLPNGVPVEYSVHMAAENPGVSASGTGYHYNDTLTAVGGTGTPATYTVSSIVTVGTPVVAHGGTGWAVGDQWTVSGAGWIQNLVVQVSQISGGGPTGPATEVTLIQPGIRNASAPANPVSISSHTGGGSGTYDLTLAWGVESAVVATAGNYTQLPADVNAIHTTGVGTGCTLDGTYQVSSVAVINGTGPTRNSGYVQADTTVEFASGSAAIDTVSFVQTDGSNDTILARAWVSSARRDVDIVKQESSRRYYVKNDGYDAVRARLKPYPASDVGEMDLTAYDSADNEYWVIKLTARRALIVRKDPNVGLLANPTDFPNGQSVLWGSNTIIQNPNTVAVDGVRLETV